MCMGGDAHEDYYSSRSVSSGSHHQSSNGQRLGGNEVPIHLTPQEMAARAAEKRLQSGTNSIIDERRKKDELIGKITEIYARKGQAAPIGLPSLPLDKLKEIYDRERNK